MHNVKSLTKPILKVLTVLAVVAGLTVFSVHDFFRTGGASSTQLQSAVQAKNSAVRPDTPRQIPGQKIESDSVDILQTLDRYTLSVLNDSTLSNEQKFDIAWNGYLNSTSSVALGTYYIDMLSTLSPLPHVEKLLQELNNVMVVAEIKNHILSALQSAYNDTQGGMTEANRQLVLNAIKNNVYNPDPAIANRAVLLYSRMDSHNHMNDIIATLDEAYQRNIISSDEYLRESTFKLSNISNQKQQNAMLSKLIGVASNSDSDLIHQTLIGSLGVILQSPSSAARIDQTTKDYLAQYLGQHEPIIHSDENNFSLVDGIDYSNWLSSYAVVKNNSDNQRWEFILNHLIENSDDTQKTVAMLNSSSEKKEIVRLAHDKGLLDTMQKNISNAMLRLKPGTDIYDAYQTAFDNLK